MNLDADTDYDPIDLRGSNPSNPSNLFNPSSDPYPEESLDHSSHQSHPSLAPPVYNAISSASGTLSIDGTDVSGMDRIGCFSMAGQDSDLFRGQIL